jgi:hypothetical protein
MADEPSWLEEIWEEREEKLYPAMFGPMRGIFTNGWALLQSTLAPGVYVGGEGCSASASIVIPKSWPTGGESGWPGCETATATLQRGRRLHRTAARCPRGRPASSKRGAAWSAATRARTRGEPRSSTR